MEGDGSSGSRRDKAFWARICKRIWAVRYSSDGLSLFVSIIFRACSIWMFHRSEAMRPTVDEMLGCSHVSGKTRSSDNIRIGLCLHRAENKASQCRSMLLQNPLQGIITCILLRIFQPGCHLRYYGHLGWWLLVQLEIIDHRNSEHYHARQITCAFDERIRTPCNVSQDA